MSYRKGKAPTPPGVDRINGWEFPLHEPLKSPLNVKLAMYPLVFTASSNLLLGGNVFKVLNDQTTPPSQNLP